MRTANAELSPAKQKLYELLKARRRAEDDAEAAAITRADRGGPLPLSFSQQRMWFVDYLEPGNPAYNVPGALRFEGRLEVAALERSLDRLVARHETLRTSFPAEGGQPRQSIRDAWRLELPVVDLGRLPAVRRRGLVDRLAVDDNRRPYSLAEGPLLRARLLRLGRDEHVLLVNMHHIIADNWSITVFVQETAELYEALVEGRPPKLPALAFQYADFAVWQRRQLSGSALDGQLEYWLRQLGGELPVLEIATDRPRPPVLGSRGARHYLDVSPEVTAELRALARREATTPFVIGLAAFALTLHRATGATDLPIGTTAAGRRHSGLESLLGLFMNLLVLRGDLRGAPTGREVVRRMQEVTVAALAHQDVPFERVVEKLRVVRDLSRTPVFQFQFNLQPASARPLERAGVLMTPIFVDSGTARFDMEMILWDHLGGLKGYMEYNVGLFDGTTLDRLGRGFRNVLRRLVRDPEAALGRLIALARVESHQLLAEWNDTARREPAGESVLPWIGALAAEAPDGVAVVFEDRRTSRGELDRRSCQLARLLRRRGVGPETVVGVSMERCPELVVSLLGILRAGAAYLPLDPDDPADRRRWMARDAGAALVLVRSPEAGSETVALDRVWGELWEYADTPPAAAVDGAGLAYVIYTSGSTGRPKGVASCHGGLANRLAWMQERFALTPRDRVLQKTSFTFDVSVWEFFWPLATGAVLVLARPGGHRDPGYLTEVVAEREITTLHFVPSMLRAFLEAPRASDSRALARVVLSGEALPSELAGRFAERLPAAELHNLYGPTEASIDVTAWRYRPGEPPRPTVPIGRPIADTRIHLLDAALRPAPPERPGELAIAGAGLARGYLGRPGLTAERFVPDPLDAVPGGRLYRTGDLVRRRAAGELEFLERLDRQVKIRGFRIELGEIETLLRRHPSVAEAAVVVEQRRAADPARLIACVVPVSESPTSPTAPTSPTGPRGPTSPTDSTAELRSWLRQRLPGYMVPAFFLALESLPRTASGKIDRGALARSAPRLRSRPEPVAAAPRGETERALAEIWRQVLGVDAVGLDENFFDVGGDSLLLAQVHSRLRDDLGVELPMPALFRHTTIRALAGHLRQEGDGEADHVAGAERARIRSRLGRAAGNDVAVIGMALRLPGADSPEQFWENLRGGVESITFFSDEDCLAAGADPALLARPEYVRAEAVLDGVELFDAGLFNMTPREAELIDPQQRFLLELGWEALERAGYGCERGRGSVGVFVGAAMSSYMFNNLSRFRAADIMTDFQTRISLFTGNDKDFHAQKLSYLLKLDGPSVNVQTACSSAVVAVHLGIRSLTSGECDMALAGGVQIRTPQKLGYLYQEGGLPSPDGHCRPFDAAAMGTLHSNGAGLVLLKRLDDAVADRDPIRAVIKGSAINNDAAAKVGFTAPSLEGIVRVAAEAQAVSGVDPAGLGFVEAHGTGTDLGDTLEVDALTRVFRASTEASQYCFLGSVKSNLGHLDTAAGVAGLAKAVLALEHAEVPPTLHFEKPNPNIPFPATPFKVNAALEPWPADLPGDGRRRAAVNVFAIGGTNAYLVLEEAPPPRPADPPPPWHLLTLSARSTAALYEQRTRLLRHLERRPELDLADVAFTLQVGRKPFPVRQAFLCHDRDEALAALRDPPPDRSWSGLSAAGRPAGFLLSGDDDGALAGLAADLYPTEDGLRREIDACCEAAREVLCTDLRPGWLDGGEEGGDAAVRKARSFAAAYALARLFSNWGIEPQAIFGLGTGEPAAAGLAGVLTLADALAVAAGGSLEESGGPAGALRLPLLSPVTGRWLTAEQAGDAAYWRRLERRDALDLAVAELVASPDRLLLELGPARLASRVEEHAGYAYEQPLAALETALPAAAVLPSCLGRIWAAGVDVDWLAVHGGRGRRRVELPPYPFERQRFWVDPPSAEAAGATPDATTRRPVDEWLYAPDWRGRRLTGPALRSLEEGECWLVASDGSPLAAAVVRRLTEAGENVVTVEAGDEPRGSDSGTFVVRPRHEEDYHGLVEELRGEKLRPARVVHLWSLGAEGPFDLCQGRGLWSLVYLARALRGASDEGAVEIGVVTDELWEFGDADRPRWEKASLTAPLRVLPREVPGFSCWCADVAGAGGRGEDRLAESLLREFGRGEGYCEVAYRGGRRWVRSFERLELDGGSTLLEDGGVYLITDGSAGFGLELAGSFARAVRARIALVGSFAMPERSEWTAWLEGHGEDEATSARIRRLLDLEETGTEVLNLTADVTDLARMKAAVGEVRRRFGRLDGVVHASAEAGFEPLAVAEIDGESFAARVGRRLGGAEVLSELLRDEKPRFCLLTSSLHSVLGEPGTLAETAVDHCLAGLAGALDGEAGVLWRNVCWEARDAAAGADERAGLLRRLTSREDLPVVCVSAVDLEARLAAAAPGESADASAGGGRQPRPDLETPYAAPSDELEEAICAIWEELFGIDGLGVDDNFFELGGHSLTAAQMAHRIRDRLEVDLALGEAMELATVRELALAVAAKKIDASTDPEVRELLSRLESLSDEEALELSESTGARPRSS